MERKRERERFPFRLFPLFFSLNSQSTHAVFPSHQQLPPGRGQLPQVHAPRDQPPGVDAPRARGRRRRRCPLFSLRPRFRLLFLAAAAAGAATAAAGGRELFAPAPVEASVLGAPPVDGPQGEEGARLRLGGLEGKGMLLEEEWGSGGGGSGGFFFLDGEKKKVRKSFEKNQKKRTRLTNEGKKLYSPQRRVPPGTAPSRPAASQVAPRRRSASARAPPRERNETRLPRFPPPSSSQPLGRRRRR